MTVESRIAIHRCTRCGAQVEVWEIGRVLIDPDTYVCGDHLQPLGHAPAEPSPFQIPTPKEAAA